MIFWFQSLGPLDSLTVGPQTPTHRPLASIRGWNPSPPAARALLESDAVAHVVTLDEDGGPQVTAAWVGLDGDEIIFRHPPGPAETEEPPPRRPASRSRSRRPATNGWGLLEYLVVYGTARVTEGGVAAEILQRLAHTYLGPDVISRGCPIPRPDTSPGSQPSASAALDRGSHPAANVVGSAFSSSPSRRGFVERRSTSHDRSRAIRMA